MVAKQGIMCWRHHALYVALFYLIHLLIYAVLVTELKEESKTEWSQNMQWYYNLSVSCVHFYFRFSDQLKCEFYLFHFIIEMLQVRRKCGFILSQIGIEIMKKCKNWKYEREPSLAKLRAACK